MVVFFGAVVLVVVVAVVVVAIYLSAAVFKGVRFVSDMDKRRIARQKQWERIALEERQFENRLAASREFKAMCACPKCETFDTHWILEASEDDDSGSVGRFKRGALSIRRIISVRTASENDGPNGLVKGDVIRSCRECKFEWKQA